MKQYKGGYNVNRYDWKNKTTEHLLNDNNLADNTYLNGSEKMKLQHSGSG